MMMVLDFLKGHYLDVAVVLLSLVRIAEYIFPNAKTLRSADSVVSGAGIKDMDGK
jgi:hypothetical protein